MYTLIIIIFALAAILGAYLISYLLMGKNTPKGVVFIHGTVAALGILLLIIYSFLYHAPLLALLFFILAALGGFYMLSIDLSGKNPPKLLALGHGSLAIIGFILLIVFGARFLW